MWRLWGTARERTRATERRRAGQVRRLLAGCTCVLRQKSECPYSIREAVKNPLSSFWQLPLGPTKTLKKFHKSFFYSPATFHATSRTSSWDAMSIPQSTCWLTGLLRHQLHCEHRGCAASWRNEFETEGSGNSVDLYEYIEKQNPGQPLNILLSWYPLYRSLGTLQVLTVSPAPNPDEEDRSWKWRRNYKYQVHINSTPEPLESIIVTSKTWMDHFT